MSGRSRKPTGNVKMTTQRVGGKRGRSAPIPPLNEGSKVICKLRDMKISDSGDSEYDQSVNESSSEESSSSGSEESSEGSSDEEEESNESEESRSDGETVRSESSGTKRSRPNEKIEDEVEKYVQPLAKKTKIETVNTLEDKEIYVEDDICGGRNWPLQKEHSPLQGYIENSPHCFVPTNGLTTRFYTIVPFYMSVSPCACKHWDEHFKQKDISEYFSEMQISVASERMSIHWDIFPSMISFKPVWRNKREKILTSPVFEAGETVSDPRLEFKSKKTDLFIKLSAEMTLVLRIVNSQELRKRRDTHDWQNENVLLHLPMATHALGQRNVYLDKKVRDPMKAWTLHAILNERSMGISDLFSKTPVFLEKEGTPVGQCSVLTVYQALYAFHSQEIEGV